MGIWTLLFCVLLCACGTGPVRSDKPGPNAAPERLSGKIVDFEWPDLQGELVHLADHRGKVVVVVFFTTWCAPCAELLPELDGLTQGDRPVRDLLVIGVSVDMKPKSLLPTFVESWRLKMPIVLAKGGALYGRTPFGRLPAVPTVFIVDKEGQHVETLVGTIPTAYILRRARALGAMR